jgi:hypothetical protein
VGCGEVGDDDISRSDVYVDSRAQGMTVRGGRWDLGTERIWRVELGAI